MKRAPDRCRNVAATFSGRVAQVHAGDVVIHAWELGRSTGLAQTLDPDEVAENADEQNRLVAITGRQPSR